MRANSIHYRQLIFEEKARLRAEALSLRKETWLKSGSAAARTIAEKGVPLVQSFGAATIGGYHAFREELDPLPLLTALHAQGFRIALPRTGEGTTLSFRIWEPGGPLKRGKFGVQEPAESEPLIQPALLLVPLVAFDRKGNRLGYGAGYYDASLRDMRARQRVAAIGVAFDEQEFPDIPREPLDEPLDMILTPSRVLACED